jgi:nanoRNase/pAp phosphatase (c-di-AMP/oligoRNAs hydrolase)
MCIGVVDGWIHLSLRTLEREGNAGRIARNLGGRKGYGGGHHALAAAQIPIPTTNGNGITKKSIDAMVRGLTKRFLKATGDAETRGSRLCKR